MKKIYFSFVHILRGLAALSVCLYHFTNGNHFFLANDNLIKKVGSYGGYGVHVFFVISGLVIPFAMHHANYQFKDFKIFLLKRVIRIEPPYLVSFLLIIALNFISTLFPYYQGKPFHPDILMLLSHLGYLNAFFQFEWINPVYWTLAIEFQYYILIALIFPLLAVNKKFTWIVTIVFFNSISFLFPNPNFIFQYSPFFTLGIVMYKYLVLEIDQPLYAVLVVALLGLIFIKFNLPGLVAGIVPVIFMFIHWENKVSVFLGDISYSLYLLHVPVGLRIINLSMNFVKNDSGKYLIILLALTVTIALSYMFYKYVELPFKKVSNKIRYRYMQKITIADISTSVS